MRQIILDTETTGLRPEEGHRIIEIGCMEMVSRRLTGNHFHYYLNPEREIDQGAMAVHGITNEFLKDKPSFKNIAEEFIRFIDGAELVIHNAPFDLGFLNSELALLRAGYKSINDYCNVIDTLAVARRLHVGQRNSLDALCKRYAVDNSKRDLHGALIDCHLLAQVYLAMTGGQESLFSSMDTSNTSSKKTEQITIAAPIDNHHLTVLKAKPDEIALHENYLQTLKKRGKCLWPETEITHYLNSW
jgi:DNA polymerase-3 subunit epsilon